MMDKKDEIILRRRLWINHGCHSSALYGDDGEMQCGKCLLDFKRASVKYLDAKLTEIAMRRLREKQNADKQDEDEMDGKAGSTREPIP